MADVLDEVRRGSSALALVVDQTSAVWPKVSAALRATCDDVEHRVTRVDNVVLLVGTSPAKRRFVNAVLKEDLLPASGGERVRLTIRRGNARGYMAETAQGKRSLGRDRAADLAAEVARTEQALTKAIALVEELKEMRSQTESSPVAVQAPSSSAKALVATSEADEGEGKRLATPQPSWLARMVLAILVFFGLARRQPSARLAPAPKPPKRAELVQVSPEPVMLIVETPPAMPVSIDERVALEMRLLEAEAAVPKARTDVEDARAAHATYEAERRTKFVEEIAALLASDDVASIEIEHPSAHLSSNVVLVDEQVNTDEDTRTWRRARRQVCACVVVTTGSDTGDFARIAAEQLKPLTPFRIDASATGLAGELAITHFFDALRREARPAFAALAIGDVLGVLRSLTEAGDRAETECRARIAEIEKSRTPEPATFREAQLETLKPVVTEAAGRVMRGAIDRWHASVAALRAEWTAAIDAAADRAAVEAIVKTLNEEAPARLANAVEVLTASISDDMQRTTTSVQGWMLDDISVRFKSLSVAPDAAVVLVEDVAEEVPSVREVPLAKVVDTFERRRVGIGLGGAAAGAALGTLIFPGIGTAVGAFVGVLAGFIETLANLKRDALARLGTHLDGVEAEVVKQVEAGLEGFSREMSASLVETLDAELARRAGAIARQREEERVALEREESKLADVAGIKSGLVRHRARFAGLEKDVMDTLERAVEARSPRAPLPLALLPTESV